MAFDNAEHFDPRPGVRRARLAMRMKPDADQDFGAEGGGKGEGESQRPPEPANAVETHSHHDGAYHTITHHADGKKERAEHPTHEHAVEHQKKMFHEDGQQEGENRDEMLDEELQG
jgi:hypothetical protein